MPRKRAAAALAALFALGAATLAPPARAAEAPVLTIAAAADTVTPDENGLWQMELRVRNRLEVGLYLDSLLFDIRDDAPGLTRMDRVMHQNMTRLAAGFSPISAGESTAFMMTPFASCERGLLRFDWYGHGSDKSAWHMTDSIAVAGGPLAAAHPSRFVPAGGRRVELVEFPPRGGDGHATGILLVHGHGAHARTQLRIADRLAAQGFGVVAVSQPGYGLSDGPPDFMGPATIAAAQAGLEALARLPGVDPKRLVAWGVSRGATAALLLAERRPAGLVGVVAQGGLYDVTAWLAGAPPSELRQNALSEMGGSRAASAARSPLAAAAKVRASVLLVHGITDDTAPIAQARAMAAAIRAGGATVDTLFLPGGHLLPRAAVSKVATDFISRLSTH